MEVRLLVWRVEEPALQQQQEVSKRSNGGHGVTVEMVYYLSAMDDLRKARAVPVEGDASSWTWGHRGHKGQKLGDLSTARNLRSESGGSIRRARILNLVWLFLLSK